MTASDAPFALVIDDDVLIRMDAADILEQSGFRTHEAGDVEEAIDVLETHHRDIQLLFTDVQMPGTRDGFDPARECAARWPHISILVASGQAKPGPDSMPEGSTFVTKPFSAAIVQQRLIEIMPDGQKPEHLKRIEQDAGNEF